MTQTQFTNVTENQALILEKLGRMVEDGKQKIVLIFKKKNKVDSENNRLVNLMLTYSRILKWFIK